LPILAPLTLPLFAWPFRVGPPAAGPLARAGGGGASDGDGGLGVGKAGPWFRRGELDFADHRLDHLGRKLKAELQVGQVEEGASDPLPQQPVATVGGEAQLFLQ
jgi:hypothetical protein